MFINYGDNSRLDADQFAPFGIVIDGMDVVDRISAAHGEQPDQESIKMKGSSYLRAEFPQLDYITSATILDSPSKAGSFSINNAPIALPPDDSSSENK